MSIENECIRLRQLGVIPSDAVCTEEELSNVLKEIEDGKNITKLSYSDFFKTWFREGRYVMALIFKGVVNTVYITKTSDPRRYMISLLTGRKAAPRFIRVLMQLCKFGNVRELVKAMLSEVVICKVSSDLDEKKCIQRVKEMYRGYVINDIYTLLKIGKARLV